MIQSEHIIRDRAQKRILIFPEVFVHIFLTKHDEVRRHKRRVLLVQNTSGLTAVQNRESLLRRLHLLGQLENPLIANGAIDASLLDLLFLKVVLDRVQKLQLGVVLRLSVFLRLSSAI